MKLPITTPSGAYVSYGRRDLVLIADLPKSDLVSVLEVDTEVDNCVYQYFSRSGFKETRMTSEELRYGATASVELIAIAKELWPNKFH